MQIRRNRVRPVALLRVAFSLSVHIPFISLPFYTKDSDACSGVLRRVESDGMSVSGMGPETEIREASTEARSPVPRAPPPCCALKQSSRVCCYT